MRPVDINSGAVQLRHALRTLRVHWESTQEDWQDVVSQQFEEEHLAPLEPRVQAALGAMSKLAQILSKAQQDCE